MIYNYKEIKEKYKNNYKIEKAIKNGEIYKIEKMYILIQKMLII